MEMIDKAAGEHGHDRRAPLSAYVGIFVCTAGVLMLEILLTRIFSFTIWYHLAYLTIGAALLSFGAAGSVLSAFPRLLRNPGSLAGISAAAAGVTIVAGMWHLGQSPLDPILLFREPISFTAGLLKYYVILCVPFLLGGIAVAAPLAAYPTCVNRLYGADLAGAAAGCGAAVAALTWSNGSAAVVIAAILLIAAAALYVDGIRLRAGLALLGIAFAVSIPWADRWMVFQPSASKSLALTTSLPNYESIHTEWSPVNRVDVGRMGDVHGGFWAVDIKNYYQGPLPRVMDIQYDAHNGSNIYEVTGPDSMAFLDYHLLRMPYLFLDRPRVLVIGVGGGIDILNALRRGATHVTGAELQPITVWTLKERLRTWCGHTYSRPDVTLVASEGRHFVRSHDQQYDLIQITATDTFSAQATGAYVLAESYLYTIEAFEDYLEHLTDDGVICIVVGDVRYANPELPSPLGTRLVLTAQEALWRRGVKDAASHLMVATPLAEGLGIHNVLIVKKSPFTEEELARGEAFGATIGVGYRLAPGRAGHARTTQLANASPEEMSEALKREPFHIAPMNDERPFFFHILRWRSLFGGDGALWYFPGSATGQVILLLMLGQAVILGGLLVFLPLLARSRQALRTPGTGRFLAYFLALGIGFMLIEISFVQKYILLLGYPTYSLSVTIVSLLVFAAVGASISPVGWANPRRFLIGLLGVMASLVAVEILVLPAARDALLGTPLYARILVTVLFQCPLGICLGMFFPTGAELVRREAPALVPWAWAVNGIGSVAGTVLAVILAMAVGFSNVALIAVGVYVLGIAPLLIWLGKERALG